MIQRGKIQAAGHDRLLDRRRAVPGRLTALTMGLGLAMSLGACSTMSDVGDATSSGVSKVASAMNPFNWFGDSDTSAPEDAAAARAKQERAVANTATKTGVKSAARDDLAQRAAQRDEERYPRLSTVPERPRDAASEKAAKARAELREGLVADTANAEYTDSQLRARTEGIAVARRPDSARSNERIAGEPPAVPAPTMPVTAAPAAPMAAAPARTATTAVAATTPRVAPPLVAPPSVAPAPAPQRASYGAQQAAAASAAPVMPVAPTRPSVPRAPQQQQAALARPAPQPPADPEPRVVLKTVQVATIYFRDGSAHLSANDRRVVAQVAEAARRSGGRLRIIGHSSMAAAGGDAERAAMVNYKVSLDRANAVAAELLRQGVPGNQMQVMAEGARNPIYAESASTGAAGNRRTEIYLDFYERL